VTDPVVLPATALDFVTQRRLATLTTLRPDGTPHVVPVGFTWDAAAGVARVTARRTSRKVRNAAAGGRAVLCSVEGPRWITLEGTASVVDDEAAVADALERYAARYERTPAPDPLRVVVEVAVDRVLSSSHLRA